MSLIPKQIVIDKIQEDVLPYMVSFPVVVENVVSNFNIDYSEISIVLQKFIDGLDTYTHADLGTSDTTLNSVFSFTILNNYFILHTDTEYLLCYTSVGKNIELAVNIENFTP